jgi:hypothetical protein
MIPDIIPKLKHSEIMIKMGCSSRILTQNKFAKI